MSNAATNPADSVRPLQPADLERVIEIDSEYVGEPRRRFFEKRLSHAAEHPGDFLHVGVVRDGGLVGFAFARILRGEFGREQAIATLDAVGVMSGSRERGVGHALMAGLTEVMRKKGVHSFQSQADWNNHGLLRFFDSCDFRLAPRLVLERSVLTPLPEPTEED